MSKKKRKSHKAIRQGVSQQLNYVKRNLKHINSIIESNPLVLKELSRVQYKYLLVIQELYRQQREMFSERKHSISNRILSIHQPSHSPNSKREIWQKCGVWSENKYQFATGLQ